MNSLIKNLFIVILIALGFFVFLGGLTSNAQTNECQVASVNSRPPGWFNVNQYSDTTPPYIYLDIQTQNCNTQNGNVLNVLIQNIDVGVLTGPALEVNDVQNIRIRVKQPGSTSQQGGSVNFETTSSEFTIPLIVGEQGCESTPGVDDCNIIIKVYNTSVSGNPEMFSNLSTGIQYECDYLCNLSWSLGCPQGQGVTPNVLTYGSPNICSTDTSPVNITTQGGSGSGGIVSSEYSTEPLAPLPGFTGNPNLGQWLESLFTILIVLAGILAFIMIVVGGLTYLTSESFGGKGQGKSYIINAIVGLILALGAWVILNTINPELAEDLNISIPTVSLDGYEYSAPGVASIGSACGPKNGIACVDCQPIEGGIELKPEVANPPHNTIRSDMRTRLYNLQNSLVSSGVSWRITEAFRPTYEQHCSQCHYNGTCVDANFTSTSPTPQNIQAFVEAAAQAGLRAVYETNSSTTINQIQSQTNLQPSTRGGQGNYLLLNGITAPHFSVYNQ